MARAEVPPRATEQLEPPREGQGTPMPWKNNSGGGWQGGGGRGPWGQGPSGPGGGPRPPSLEELLKKSQDRFKGVLPGGGWGAKGVLLVIGLVIVAWLASGFYRV